MSRLWKRKDRIFVFDHNTLILSNRIEDLILKLQSSIGVHIEIINIVDVYIAKIKEIINYLDTYKVDYYSEDFTLDSIITETLKKDIETAEKELIKAINKTKHHIYINFTKTPFAILIIKANIYNYNKLINNIRNYSLKDNIDNIIKYKYDNMNKFYLKETIKKDKKFLNNIGRKDLIKYIDSCTK